MSNKLNSAFGAKDNVSLQVIKADGKKKLLYRDHFIGRWLLKQVRKVTKVGSYFHTYGIRIPLLTGTWGYSMTVSNGITNAGRASITSLLGGLGAVNFKSIGMGTGTTAFNATQTALVTGVKADGTADGGVHVLPDAQVTNSSITTTITDDTLQATGTVAITATIAVTESGLFSLDTAGVMLARQAFSAVNVINGDSLVLNWKIQNA